MKVRVRLAPSPTGTLHIGTARTALFNWLFAKHEQGEFLIRIEDTDKERSKPQFSEDILEGLKWLGIECNEKPVIQSERINAHKEAIKSLIDEGFAYRCYVTDQELEEMRKKQKDQGLAPRYDNRHRYLSKEAENKLQKEGKECVIRFKIEDEAFINWNDLIRGPMNWKGSDLGGDMVIARRAPSNEIGDPLYNLVVVIDDSFMEITHVIRGEDHISNTAKQILVYQALDKALPKFAHTPLILNAEGKKLSKRDGVTSVIDFRSMGYTPQALANYMALLGWSPPEDLGELFTINQAAKIFNFDRINKAGAKFDWDKLKWINSQVIHNFSTEELLEYLKPLWIAEGWQLHSQEWNLKLVELIQPSLILLKDGINQGRPFFLEPSLKSDAIEQLETEGAKNSLKILISNLEKTPWDGFEINQAKKLINETANSSGEKKGLIMKSLRAALLGEMQGPDLISTWSLLAQIGQDRQRIFRSI